MNVATAIHNLFQFEPYKVSTDDKETFKQRVERAIGYHKEGVGTVVTDYMYDVVTAVIDFAYEQDIYLHTNDVKTLNVGTMTVNTEHKPTVDHEIYIEKLGITLIINACHNDEWEYSITEILPNPIAVN